MNTLGCAQITRFTAYCWGNCLCLWRRCARLYKRESFVSAPFSIYSHCLCISVWPIFFLLLLLVPNYAYKQYNIKKTICMCNWSEIDWSIVPIDWFIELMEAKTWKSMSKHVKRTSFIINAMNMWRRNTCMRHIVAF